MTDLPPDVPTGFEELVDELSRLSGDGSELSALSAAISEIRVAVEAEGGPPNREALWQDVKRRMDSGDG